MSLTLCVFLVKTWFHINADYTVATHLTPSKVLTITKCGTLVIQKSEHNH